MDTISSALTVPIMSMEGITYFYPATVHYTGTGHRQCYIRTPNHGDPEYYM